MSPHSKSSNESSHHYVEKQPYRQPEKLVTDLAKYVQGKVKASKLYSEKRPDRIRILFDYTQKVWSIHPYPIFLTDKWRVLALLR